MAEDAGDVHSPDDNWVPTGRRRSTYSPPPMHAQYQREPGSPLGGPPAASPNLSPALHEGDHLDSDEGDEGDTEVVGFSPPPRRSLDDRDLVSEIQRVDTGTIQQISLLQQELELREADARDFQLWERAMLALGTPEALSAVEQARPAFTGVVPIIPPPSSGDAAPTPAVEPAEPAASGPAPERAPAPGSAPTPGPASASQSASGPHSSAAPQPPHEPPPAHVPSAWEYGAPEYSRSAFGRIPSHNSGSGIDLPVADDATIDAVLLDDREPATESQVTLHQEFVVVERDDADHAIADHAADDDTASAANEPPPLVLPPEPTPEGDLDRVLRARWVALDTPASPPPPPVGMDTTVGPVSTPGRNLLLADVGLSDVRVVSVDTGGIAKVARPGEFPPSGPTPLPADAIADEKPSASERSAPRLFSLERGGVEPTPIEQRNGRALRLVWLWFGANGSALSVTVGALLIVSGMSLRQGIVAALIGVGLSFLPLGLGTLAGKRSGMPTMVISRATFGLLGNVLPAVLAVVTRLFWGAAFLWLLATTTLGITGDAVPENTRPLIYLGTLAVGILLATAVAVFGFRLFERIQLVLSVFSAIVLAAFLALTAQHVDLGRALTVQDGPWIRVVGGAVLVFSVVGLLWAQSSSDLARYQRVQSSGARSMLWSSFGAGLPALALLVWGCVLAASDPAVAKGLVTAPFATLVSLLPAWFPMPLLLLATALPLLSALTVTLYSGGLALQSTGLRVARDVGVVGAAILVLAIALVLSLTVADMASLLRDAATTLAVPVAAWTGIFSAEMMLRHRRFDTRSLLQRGGIYADFRWTNLISLIVATLVGFGLTSATVSILSWQGYLLRLAGLAPESALAQADPGVLVALGLGLVAPLLFGVNAVRSQEGGRQ